MKPVNTTYITGTYDLEGYKNYLENLENLEISKSRNLDGAAGR